MARQFLSVVLFISYFLVAQSAHACGFHNFYMNPDNYGPVEGTLIKLAGLAPPEPSFKVKHAPMAKVPLGVESEILVEYERPWFSSDVRIQLNSSKGIRLADDVIELEDLNGAVKINFLLERLGYNTITVKVTGEHKGKLLAYSSIIYIQGKQSVAAVDKE